MRKSNLATVAAIAVVAYAAADLVHEVAGHTLVARLSGIRVVSISTVAIQTAQKSRAVAAAGTIANVVCGALALALAERRRRFSSGTYCLWLFGVVGMMNSGYLVFSGLLDSGDWAAVIAGARPSWAWRLFIVAVGVIAYSTAIRVAARAATPWIANGDTSISDFRRVILVSYLAGGVLLLLGSAFNPIGRELVLISGVGASFGLTFGLLLVPGILASDVKEPGWIASVLELQPAWVVAALVVAAVFVGVLGPGVRLAR